MNNNSDELLDELAKLTGVYYMSDLDYKYRRTEVNRSLILAISMIHVEDYGPEEWMEVIYYLTGKNFDLEQDDIYQASIEEKIEKELERKVIDCHHINK